MACSDDVGKKISQLHQELVNTYEKSSVWKRTSSCNVCAERDVTQEGSRGQTWQSVMGEWAG